MSPVSKPATTPSPKATKLKNLPTPSVSPKDAGSVKGGGASVKPAWGSNHNQSLRIRR
jgi:hypothetical protein